MLENKLSKFCFLLFCCSEPYFCHWPSPSLQTEQFVFHGFPAVLTTLMCAHLQNRNPSSQSIITYGCHHSIQQSPRQYSSSGVSAQFQEPWNGDMQMLQEGCLQLKFTLKLGVYIKSALTGSNVELREGKPPSRPLQGDQHLNPWLFSPLDMDGCVFFLSHLRALISKGHL